MDEFFAAVEKLDNPSLVGKPLLVGGDPKARGVVATASYEARVFGCHSAMAMAKAVRLCPHAIIIHPHFERYSAASKQVFEIFRQFTPLVEGLSIDEAFLDLSGTERLHELGGTATRHDPADSRLRNADCGLRISGKKDQSVYPSPTPDERQSEIRNPKSAMPLDWARGIALRIKSRIREETGLTASVGVSFNKFLAKLASDLKKPDGLVVIEPSRVREILDPLPVMKIWGVGPAAAGQLERLNIRTIGQLARADAQLLGRTFGAEMAEHYLALAHGQDDRPVETEGQAKSVGQEETFAVDIDRLDPLRGVLLGQVQEVARRLRADRLKARTVTLKIRHGDFTTITRSRTLDAPTHSTDDLWDAAKAVLEEWAAKQFRPLRLLGMHASNLTGEHGGQLGLFTETGDQKRQRLDKTVDDITTRFGEGTIRRGK
jgi:DNA polymerase-4